MNASIFIILVEVIVVLSVILIFLVFTAWKQKKNKNTEYEQLLNGIAEQEEGRKTQLIEYLTGHQGMENQAALELCEDFIESEKQFMYRFLERQMKQTTLSGFYGDLCGLLDKYLNLLPEAVEIKQVEQQAPDAEKPLETEQTADSLVEETDSDFGDEEPDWGDAFAESGDQVDESVQDEFDIETGKEG